jgi:hypothetical protein
MKLGNIKNNKTFEQIAPYREKTTSWKVVLHVFTGLLQDGTILFIYQFESFASGYPKSEKSTGSCLFGSEELFYVVTYL